MLGMDAPELRTDKGAEQALSAPSEVPQGQSDRPLLLNTKPYRLLDAWRGVAALWVVLLHCSGEGIPPPLAQFSFLGLLGVPMFFVISGYCIANAAVRSLNTPRPLVHFLVTRLKRIYPPYFFASLLTILLATLLASLVEHHVLNFFHRGPRYYLGAFTLSQPLLHVDYILPVFWSLCYEAAFYLIVAVALILALWTKQSPRLLDVFGAVTLGTLLWLNVAAQTCSFPWNRWPQFGFGVLVYQILAQPKRNSPRIIFLICAALMLIWTRRHVYQGSLELGSIEVQSLFCLPFAALLIAFFRWDRVLAGRWPVRLFSWIGLFSYSLYLSHYIALRVVAQGAPRVPAIESHPLLLFVVKIVVCIAGGWLFFHCFERPFLNTRQRQEEREAPESVIH